MTAATLLKSCSAIALAVGASAALVPTSAAAQTWTGAVSDDYADGANWTGGVAPAVGTVVVIDTNNNAPVADTGDVVNGGQLNIGPNAAGTLTVRGGGVLAAGSIGVGGSNNGVSGNGTLLVTGTGSLVTSDAQTFVGIRDNSTGNLTVSDGATIRTSSLQIGGGNGLGAGATGTVTITGVGSRLEFTSGLLLMGGNTVNPGRGTLNILAGGRAVGANGTTNFINPVSTINISGANSSLFATANLALDGTLLVEDGGAISYDTIGIGGTATLRNGTLSATVVGSSGGLGISAGGVLTSDDSAIAVGSNFNITGVATLRGTAVSAPQIGIAQNGVLNIGGADGAAPGAAGTLTAQSITVSEPNSRLVFNHAGPDLVVATPITGNGRVLHRAGTTVLTTGAHTGSIANIDVTGGRLFVDGRVSARNLTLANGATLGGSGTLNGSVAVTDGIIAPGNRGVGVFTVGNLSLTGASVLNFDLGAPGTPGVGSDLITVGNIDNIGNLTLDGTLNVANVGGFGAGLYRLINYSGTLIDNGLDIGAVPTGFAATDLTVQTAVARQVNLLVGSPVTASFWDGTDTTGNGVVDGGTGTWSAGRTNWTNAAGTANGRYSSNATLIFAGTGGVVTIDNGSAPGVDNPQVTIIDTNQFAPTGMQFASTGYLIQGGELSFGGGDGIATVRVGDGTAAGAAINATIASNLILANRLDKTDLGTLTLTGQNLFLPGGGRSRVQGGTLEIAGGGQFLTGGLEIALPGQAAAFRVTGAGSVASVGIGIRTGFVNNGPGTVEVLDGGTLRDSARGGNEFGVGSLVRVSGAGSILDLANNSTSQGSFIVENGAVARVAPVAFSSTGSLVVRNGGRIEQSLGDGSFGSGTWRVPNGLIQGAGTAFNSAFALSIAPATAANPAANFIVENNAALTVTINTDSALGFEGPLSTLIVRDGATFTLTGGINAGLQTENARLTVDNATFAIDGALTAGQRFGNTAIVLRNADFTARAVELISATDSLAIGAAAGEAAGGVRRFDVGTLTLGNAATTLTLNHDAPNFALASTIGGAGTIRQLTGDTRLTGDSRFFGGQTIVTGGTLRVDNLFGDAGQRMTVSGGATLSGRGTIGGLVTVADGIIRPGGDALDAPTEVFGRAAGQALLGGDAVGTLTFSGELALGAAARLGFQLGAPTGTAGIDSDLINVAGNLTLDGTLEVTDVGGFGEGLYRLINYGGTLTDNGLDIGTVPGGFRATDLAVQTSVASQVNLIVAAPAPTASSFTFWDGPNMAPNGAIDGGSGTWSSAGTNWSIADGSINGVYDRSRLLIFSGTGGAVTVDNAGSPVTLENGVQFAADGYTVAGGNIVLDDDNVDRVIFRVGDGTAAGAGFTATIGSTLTGGAELQKTDLGTLVLTGANSYTGGTHIVNGAIRGNATSIQGNVRLDDDGTLVFDQTSDGIFAGLFSGSGVVRTRGTGVLDITGASNAFEGMTIVEAGTLRLTGALGGLTRIGSAGTLTGNGTLAQLDVAGRVAPGGAGIATLTVASLNGNQETRLPANGNSARGIVTAAIATTPDIVFRAGSIYAVDLAASGASDRINVSGSATLEGGTVAITTLDADLTYVDGAIFRILNAEGGLTGTFAGLTESSAFLDFALGYDPTGAFLRLSQVRMFPDVARTINQRAAASALSTFLRPAGSDGLAVYNAVLGLDEDTARAAFDASSGEIYASLLAARQRQGFALTNRFTSRAQADLREGLGIWGGITGHDGRIDADDDLNAGRVSSDGIGGEIGIDYRGASNDWAAGFGGGWQDGKVDLPIRASYAKNKTWHVGGYLRVGTGGPGFTVVATAVHARADADVTRSINFGTIARAASANTNVSTTALGVDVRYGWGLGNWSLGPVASVGLSNSRFSAFSETGANALNLSGAGSRDKLTRTGVGGFARYGGADGYIDLTAYYVPSDRDDARATLSMAGSPQAFTVLAPRGSKASVRVSASSQYNIAQNLSLGGNIGFDRGADERDFYGHVRLSYRF